MPQHYVGKVIRVLPLGGGVFVLLLPLGGRGGCPADPVLIESDVCYLSETYDSVTPNRFVPMTLHTIPDSFCAGAETTPDRASVHI